MLAERRDLQQGQGGPGKVPVGPELDDVHDRPFDDERESPGRETIAKDLMRLDRDLGAAARVPRVEVRRMMVVRMRGGLGGPVGRCAI